MKAKYMIQEGKMVKVDEMVMSISELIQTHNNSIWVDSEGSASAIGTIYLIPITPVKTVIFQKRGKPTTANFTGKVIPYKDWLDSYMSKFNSLISTDGKITDIGISNGDFFVVITLKKENRDEKDVKNLVNEFMKGVYKLTEMRLKNPKIKTTGLEIDVSFEIDI
jgi:hypothetical protein